MTPDEQHEPLTVEDARRIADKAMGVFAAPPSAWPATANEEIAAAEIEGQARAAVEFALRGSR